MTATSFGDLLKAYGHKRRGRGCPVCGAENRGVVTVHIKPLGPTGTLEGAGKQTAGRTVSMCEKHACELADRLLQMMPGMAVNAPSNRRAQGKS